MTEVFGDAYSGTYDDVYADKDYTAECDLLEAAIQRHANRPVSRILDLGCGTGRHAIELARRGHTVVGVDRSAAMLARARERADAQGVSMEWNLGDLRTTRLTTTFDAVTLMFAVLGYQLTDDDVAAAFHTVAHHLAPGGVMVFDVWYGPAVLATGPDRRQRRVSSGGQMWTRTSSGAPRFGADLVDVTIELDPDDGDAVVETHTMRHFTRDGLAKAAEAAGLTLVALTSATDLSEPASTSTWNVMGVVAAL